MITTLTLNPCIDHTIEIGGLEIGGTNRIKKVKKNVGGKGINVCTALTQLGYETAGLIFSYEREAVPLAEHLTARGSGCRAISVPGELRTNIKVFDTVSREMTEFNESGCPVPESAAEEMLSLIKEQLPETEILVVTGSVPPGVPADFYRRAITLAKKVGVMTILDADGELFREGLKAKPTMIKPNLGELQRYLGKTLNSEQEIIDAAEELVRSGIEYVCVSVGADGAYLVCRDGAYHTKGAQIEVKGVQGAGDSLVAGFSIGLLEQKCPGEMLKLAVACADGSLIHEGTEMCTKMDVDRLIGEIKLRSIEKS
ncbi:MAG: 1-phosphofructokinase family hexose kinase [Lachnospiraceae bacterium]|nr:1-phosphofructokinase family hexose kinase [Lachnospiraceae bacterium]